jgi:hypothetical protein
MTEQFPSAAVWGEEEDEVAKIWWGMCTGAAALL